MQCELGSSSVAPQCADKRLRRWRAQVAQLRKQLTLTRCPPSTREQTISGESLRWPPLAFIFCRCICNCICELHLLARNARKASTEAEAEAESEAASTCGFNTEFAAPPTLIGSASMGATLWVCVWVAHDEAHVSVSVCKEDNGSRGTSSTGTAITTTTTTITATSTIRLFVM